MPRFKFTQQLMLCIGIIALGFMTLIGYALWVLSDIRIAGNRDTQIVQAQRVTETVLPIPGQMLEVHLLVNQLRAAASLSKRSQIRSRIIGLRTSYKEQIAALQQSPLPPAIREALSKNAEPDAQAFFNRIEEGVLPAARSGDPLLLDAALQELDPLFFAMQTSLHEVVSLAKENSQRIRERADQHSAQSRLSLIVLSLLVSLGAIVIGFLIIRALHRHVGGDPQDVAEIVHAVAQGDLSAASTYEQHSGLLRDTLFMAHNLGRILEKLHSSAMDLSSTSYDLAGSSEQTVSKVSEQNAALVTIQQATALLNQSIQNITANSSQVQTIATSAHSAAEEGARIVSNTEREMMRIAQSIEESSQDIALLSEKSRTIDKVVAVIREIADQTNLLALNAAIEAARAGEQGRGFSVVADEVRKLAERTAFATTEIQQISHQIGAEVQQSLTRMTQVVSDARTGSESAQSAKQKILSIETAFKAVTDQIADISLSLTEQSGMSQEMESNIRRIALASEELKSATSRINGTSSSFAALAGQTISVVSGFKLDRAGLLEAA